MEPFSDFREPPVSLRPPGDAFATAFRASNAGMAINRLADGVYIEVNAAFLRLTGFSREEIVGRPADEVRFFAEPKDREEFDRELRLRGRIDNAECRLVTATGEVRTALASSTLTDLGGEAVVVSSLIDITDRKSAEEARRETEERFRTVIENSLDGVNMLDLRTGRYTFMSPAQVALTGFTEEEILDISAEEAYQRVHPDDREVSLRQQQAVARGEADEVLVEYRWRVKSGEYRWFSDKRKLVRDADGSPVALVGVSRDITDRKRADEELLAAKRQADGDRDRLRAVLEAIPSAVVLVEAASGKFSYMNRRAFDLYGIDYVGFDLETHLARVRALRPDGSPFPLQEMPVARSLASREEVRDVEMLIERADGTRLPVLVSSAPVFAAAGAITTVVVVFDDISERARAETALREERHRLEQERLRLQAIIDTIPVGLFIVEDGGRLVVTNEQARRIWGGEVPVERISDYSSYVGYWPETGERLAAEDWPAAQALLHGRTTSGVLVDIDRFDGTRGSIIFSGAPIKDADGRTSGAVVATLDVSELKEAQARLEEADRRKNEFLAVLSHELRNPLAPLWNSVFILEHAVAGGEQAALAREVIRRQTVQLSRLVDDLLEVTRITRGKVQLQLETLELASLVRRCAEDQGQVFAAAGVALDVAVPNAPVWVRGDPARLAQVIGNLLSNAVKFTDSGGRTTLSLTTEEGRAVVRVRDTGMGISSEVLGRLFEPFVQAEQALDRNRGGLGLGLAVLKGLVDLHGGTVAAHSDGPGRGSEFVVTLPTVPPPREQPRMESAINKNRRRVLVIEDNADSADSLRAVLELHGHEVAVAESGTRGLEMASRLKPDVVLCDIGLPGMDGFEVARVLRADPQLKQVRLVALSGYALPEDVERSRAAGFDEHLAKPVDPAFLAGL